MRIRIGTRGSDLALAQAREVAAGLASSGTDTELVVIRTTGDRSTQPFSKIGGAGLFTRELEDALVRGEVDCCVHSLKDLPTDEHAQLRIAAVLERADPRDALVCPSGGASSIAGLRPGARVGTSSLRRRALLLAARPDLIPVELRGNVPTRLAKLESGEADAAILATAGLERLGLRARIAQILEPPDWLPAPGQGAIAVQVRAGDTAIAARVELLDHEPTAVAVRAERGLLAALGGGCQVPVAALARVNDGRLHLDGAVVALDGTSRVSGSRSGPVSDAEGLARELGEELLNLGAGELLVAVRDIENLPATDEP